MMWASLAVAAGFVALLARPGGVSDRAAPSLVVYCGAGLRPPVETAARQYELEYGVAVRLQYAASATLLANAEVSRTGDLYIPGDDLYIDLARRRGLAGRAIPLASMRPVLAVKNGNPRGIRTFQDLLRPGVRLSHASADTTAVGRLLREHLEPMGLWKPLEAHAAVVKNTVPDVAADVRSGAVDAAMVWNATVHQMPQLEAVELPELASLRAGVSAALLASSARPAEAMRFARFLAAKDKGAAMFARDGYEPAGGDVWAYRPRLAVLADERLRPAVESAADSFERIEGAEVNRVYGDRRGMMEEMASGRVPDVWIVAGAVPQSAAQLFAERRSIAVRLAPDRNAPPQTPVAAMVAARTPFPGMCARLIDDIRSATEADQGPATREARE